MFNKIRKFQISVIGSSLNIEKEMKFAYKLGKFIAEKGWILINGGRGGVMEASAKGAFENGGIVIGILPDIDIDAGNKYCTIKIPTGIGFARNSITAIAGDVIVVIGGATGTLSELCFAWNNNKVIIAASWLEGVSKDYAGKRLDYKRNDFIKSAENEKQLFDMLENEYNNYLNK